MLTTREGLMFLEFHMKEDTKATRDVIIATETLLRDPIDEKTTQVRPRLKFISFMWGKGDKIDTTKDAKR